MKMPWECRKIVMNVTNEVRRLCFGGALSSALFFEKMRFLEKWQNFEKEIILSQIVFPYSKSWAFSHKVDSALGVVVKKRSDFRWKKYSLKLIVFEINTLDACKFKKSCSRWKIYRYRCYKSREKTLFWRCSITRAVFWKVSFLRKWKKWKEYYFYMSELLTLRVERTVTSLTVHWAL